MYSTREAAAAAAAAAAAERLRQSLLREEQLGAGAPMAVDAFHRQLPLQLLRCDICQISTNVTTFACHEFECT